MGFELLFIIPETCESPNKPKNIVSTKYRYHYRKKQRLFFSRLTWLTWKSRTIIISLGKEGRNFIIRLDLAVTIISFNDNMTMWLNPWYVKGGVKLRQVSCPSHIVSHTCGQHSWRPTNQRPLCSNNNCLSRPASHVIGGDPAQVDSRVTQCQHYSMPSQKAVTAYFSSKQLLPFGFAPQGVIRWGW